MLDGDLSIWEELREEDRRRRLEMEEARASEAEEQEKADTAPRTMRAWAISVPERGVTLNLDEFPFQEAWYSEEIAEAREVVWMKAAQVGMSGYAWRWAARRAERFGDRVIYFFPTDDDVTEFGDQRIEPSIQESAYLLSRMPQSAVRNKHAKQIGSGFLLLRGTQSAAAVQSVDADSIVFDEYEYLNKRNLAQAERRVAGAKAAGRFPRIRRFGYPTTANSGIDAMYRRSDRRQWTVTCPACGLAQHITWAENVRWTVPGDDDVHRMGQDQYEDYRDVAEAWRACRDCEESLESPLGVRGPIHNGEWIPENPGRDLIGFLVSRLIVPRTDLIELVRNSRLTAAHEQEAFWNNDLGLPFSPAEAALTEEDVKAAMSLGQQTQFAYHRRYPLVMGVDVASERKLTAWIDEVQPDNSTEAIWIGEPDDFGEVETLIKTYRPALIVVDGLPERRMARALAASFPGRVVIAAYDGRNASDAFRYDPKKNMVTINRTEALDAMMDSVRQLRRKPTQDPPPRFIAQMTSPKRRTIETGEGAKVKSERVYESNGPDGDDFAHAAVYAMVAKEMRALRGDVDAQMAAAQGERIPSERFGFRNEYRPGFGEGRPGGRRA